MRSNRLRLVVLLAIAVLVAALTPVAGSLATDQPQATIGAELADYLRVAPDDQRIEVIVSFHDHADTALLGDLGVPNRALEVLPMSGAYLLPAEIAEVASWPQVRGIHANLQLEHFNHQSVPMSGAPDVWALGYTGAGVTVAIHDTGIDGTHPDLPYPDKTIQNIKIAHARFVDFAHGVNHGTPTLTVEDQVHTDTTSGHGTHVAGSAAGAGGADPAYRGMAPDASVVGFGAGDVVFVYAALEGYDWLFRTDDDGVANHEKYDIRVINNSWGTVNNFELDVDNPLVQAIYAAYAAGITPVFSAGNSGPGADTLNFYAQAPWVVGVGAIDKAGEIASFSSRGYPNHPFKTPDVSGVGVNVESSAFTVWPVVPYISFSGTSMSAPHVTGLVALMLEANPDLSPDQVQEILRATTSPLAGLDTWEAGTGFIDALAAVEAALDTEGDLDAFLAGGTAHTLESAAATVAEGLPYDPVPEEWTGTVGPAALWVGVNDQHTFTVDSDAEFLNARIVWDRSLETLDLFLIDPDGNQHAATSGILDYGLGSSKNLRIRNPVPGEWTVEVRGEVSVVTPYAGRIVQYLAEDSNWPDADEVPQTAVISPDGFFKYTPYGLGFASTHFMTTDGGFYIFHVRDSDGNVVSGAQVDLVIHDRTGEEVFRERAVQRGDGRYQVVDIFFDHTWEGEPGRNRVTFEHVSGIDEEITVLDGTFFLNHIDVQAASVDGDGFPRHTVQPGDEVRIEGGLFRVNDRVATLRYEPFLGADVTATLLDGDGEPIGEAAETTTDLLDGSFALTLAVPGDATSLSGVLVEARYDDATFLVGPGYWYGTRMLALALEGVETVTTGVSLEVAPDTVRGGQRTVQVDAAATHAGGVEEIATVDLVVHNRHGQVVAVWTAEDFDQDGDHTLTLTTGLRLTGPGPWEFLLTMTDSDETYTAERTVRHESGPPE
jgi:serine protease AprX